LVSPERSDIFFNEGNVVSYQSKQRQSKRELKIILIKETTQDKFIITMQEQNIIKEINIPPRSMLPPTIPAPRYGKRT